MAGPRSDRPIGLGHRDGYQSRPAVRVSTLYATGWRTTRQTTTTPLADALRFGRLDRFYRAAMTQLPAVIATQPVDPATVAGRRWSTAPQPAGTQPAGPVPGSQQSADQPPAQPAQPNPPSAPAPADQPPADPVNTEPTPASAAPAAGLVHAGRLWLLAMPSGQVVVALSLDLHTHLTGTIDLLEDLYYEDITITTTTDPATTSTDPVTTATLVATATDLVTTAATLARQHHIPVPDRAEFAPERHQIVFSPTLDTDDPADLIQRVIYRADLPHRPEHSTIGYPAELNRRPTTLAAV